MPIKFDLKKYKHTDIFCETGTFKGAGVQLALDTGFTEIHTIEIQDKLVKEAKEKFKSQNVKVYHGSSETLLHKIIKDIDEPITFWLDAHVGWVCDTSVKVKSKCPLYEELEAIAKHPRKDHVILIDDLRVIKKSGKWAKKVSMKKVLELIKKINPEYTIVYDEGAQANDILIAIPNEINSTQG